MIQRLRIRTLPDPWPRLVAEFAALKPKLAHPDYIRFYCFQACIAFQEFLDDRGLLDEDLFEAVAPLGWDVVEVDQLADGTPLPDWVKNHWVFRFETFYFDWSARQFGDEYRFPEVYIINTGAV